MLFRIFLICFTLPHLIFAQQAREEIKKMRQVNFRQPVMVFFHLDFPVKRAEYKLVIDKSIIPILDTLSYKGLLHHPEIYFAKVSTNSIPGEPWRKYYMAQPETADGIYPFGPEKFPHERLIRPPKGKFYSRQEPAASYRTWLVRQDSTDLGYDGQINTLPGVDSVRVIYIIKKRERWKRRRTANWVK